MTAARLSALLLGLLLLPLGAPAAAQPATAELEGAWVGGFALPEYARFVDVAFARDGRRWRAVARLTAAGGSAGIAVHDVEVRGEEIAFRAELSGALLRFRGRRTGEVVEGSVEAYVPRTLRKRIRLATGSWRLAKVYPTAYDAQHVIEQVRGALGAGAAWSLPHGFLVEERSTGFAARYGLGGRFVRRRFVRGGEAAGYDGERPWTLFADGTPAAPRDRQAEELRLLALVRGFGWLDDRAGAVVRLLGERQSGDRREIVFAVGLADGEVGARLYVDLVSWMPVRAEVEGAAGARVFHFEEYRRDAGFLYPHRIVLEEEGERSVIEIAAVRALEPEDAAAYPFERPDPPYRISFDPAASAEVEAARGGRDGHHFVRARVDGRDAGWFLVDTGSPGMWIDTRVADSLGLPVAGALRGGGSLREVASFRLGPAALEGAVFFARDLSPLEAPGGEPAAGILGFPFFSQATVEIDYRKDRIRIHDPARFVLARGDWQPLAVEPVPLVRARFPGGEQLFRLDTGKSGTVSFYPDFIQEEELLDGRPVLRMQTRTASGPAYELIGKLKWFELAGHRFSLPTVNFKLPGTYNSDRGAAGIIGRGFLERFTVVLNYPRERIALLVD